MAKLDTKSKLFISLVILAGLGALAGGLLHWECRDLVRFFSSLMVTSLASWLKVSLPGVNGNMSVNLPFLLIAIAELSLGEAIVIAAVSTFIQCLPSADRRMQAVQVMFNVSTLLLAVAAGNLVFLRAASLPNPVEKWLLTVMAGAAYLLANTLPVAAVVSITESKNLMQTWDRIFSLTFPYFGFGAAIAAVAVTALHYTGWQTPLLIAPLMVLTFRSYRRLFGKPQAAMQMHSAAAAD